MSPGRERAADARAIRADLALVERGLARSRAQARDLITAGVVEVDGRGLDKPAARVTPAQEIRVTAAGERWVGRGAEKLLAALETFGPEGLTVAGRHALDAGASTGGFTQVLLRGGTTSVVALDVGHGQLAPEVAGDPRVRDLSGRSVRGLTAGDLGGPVDLVVADLSFISLALVMADLARVCQPGADLVVLVKPQFEVGRTRLGKNGVVRDPRDQRDAIRAVARAAADAGLAVRGLIDSPLLGGHGNREFLLWLAADETVGWTWQALCERVDRLVPTGEG